MDKPDIAALLHHYGATDVPESDRFRPMLCPFHDERRPSATVNTDENRFRCFVCDVNGDSIDVVRWRENLDYPSALDFIETIIGISVDQLSRGVVRDTRRRPIFGEPRANEGNSTTFPPRVRRKPRPWT